MIDMNVPFYASCPCCQKAVPVKSSCLGDVRPEDLDRVIGDMAARHSFSCASKRVPR